MQVDGLVPIRQRALAEAQRFAASWLGLGEVLSDIAKDQNYQGWGFDSFAAYCRKELQLRQDVAEKLARSFGWLKNVRPHRAEVAHTAPPLDVVDLLSQVRERTQLSEAALSQVERQVLDEGGGLSRAQLLRQLRREDPQAFRERRRAGDPDAATAAPQAPVEAETPADAVVDPHQLRKTLALAERLAQLLAEQGLEAGLGRSMRTLIGALRQRVVTDGQNVC